jgi:hypothetical protein
MSLQLRVRDLRRIICRRVKILQAEANQQNSKIKYPRWETFLRAAFREGETDGREREEGRVGQEIAEQETADAEAGPGGYPVGGKDEEGGVFETPEEPGVGDQEAGDVEGGGLGGDDAEDGEGAGGEGENGREGVQGGVGGGEEEGEDGVE